MASEMTAPVGGVSIGIDIGGTFTDVVCATASGTHILKLPTTRDDPARAVLAALAIIQKRFAIDPASITSMAASVGKDWLFTAAEDARGRLSRFRGSHPLAATG